jgi:hypothetical protein
MIESNTHQITPMDMIGLCHSCSISGSVLRLKNGEPLCIKCEEELK